MRNSGFTLVELSVVLVIIGLLAGSILVGRDLIITSERRATVSQLDRIEAAVATFQNKYTYLPGDVPSAQAAQMGIFAVTGANAGLVGFGDGNNLLEGGNMGGHQGYLGELTMFFRHLTDTSLLEGSYGVKGNSALVANSMAQTVGNLSGNEIGLLYPMAKWGHNSYIQIALFSNRNYYYFENIMAIWTPGGGWGNAGVTPAEAAYFDQKLDDGLPNTGTVQSWGTPGDGCHPASGANQYDLITAPNISSCWLVKDF